MLKLDTHAHWFPQEWVDTIVNEGPKNGVEISRNEQGRIVASRSEEHTSELQSH